MSNDAPSGDSTAAGPPVPYAATIHVRDHCLCLHTQRAARAGARRFDEAFRPLGLRAGQFSLLMSLNRPEPPTIGSVATLLGMDRTTLTAALKPLERDGFVGLHGDPRDGRVRRLALTDRGRALLARALPIWISTHREIEAPLGADAADRLRRELDALAAPQPADGTTDARRPEH